MKTRAASLRVALVCLLLAALLAPSWAARAAPEDAAGTPSQVIAAINAYRAQNSIFPLNPNSLLAQIAQDQADYQATIQTLTHRGEGGTTVEQRAAAVNYGTGFTTFVNEIAYGGTNAGVAEAVNWWKGSTTHNSIMLNTTRHEIGAGVATATNGKVYYTVVVGYVSGGTTPLPLNATIAPPPVQTATPGTDGEIVHTVRAGETIETIAAAYGVSLNTVFSLNGLTSGAIVVQDQVLLIRQPNTSIPKLTETPTPETGAGLVETASPEATEEEGGIISLPLPPVEDLPTPGTLDPFLFWGLIGLLLTAAILWALVFLVRRVMRGRKGVQETDPLSTLNIYLERRRSVPFAELDHAQQFKVLEELGQKVLGEYPVDLERIEPLRYTGNAEFKVVARPRKAETSQRYTLRISAPHFHSEKEILSELQWLEAINTDTDLIVSKPVQTKGKRLLVKAESGQVPEPRYCVVFEWLEGDAMHEADVTPAVMERVGAFVAKLHAHGAAFSLPRGFTRKHWDYAGLTGEQLDVPAEQARANLLSDDLGVVDATASRLRRTMDTLGDGPEVYGLIHADLHARGYIFHLGEVRVLDFDTCGYGYYAYDLAAPLANFLRRKDLGALKAGLLRGYRGHREFSAREEEHLPSFIAARLMFQTLLLSGHREDPWLKNAAPRLIQEHVGLLKAFVK